MYKNTENPKKTLKILKITKITKIPSKNPARVGFSGLMVSRRDFSTNPDEEVCSYQRPKSI